MTQEISPNPILTVAIPTYNGAKTLRDTLDSIVNQLQPRVNILISDNASTDETAELIKKYQSEFPAILYRVNKENLGADKNFDLAIREATGEFVWLFGDDDLMERNAISKVLGLLNTYSDLAAIFINYSVYSPENVCIDTHALKINEDQFFENGDAFFQGVTIAPIFCSSNIVNRLKWREINTDQFVGTNWLHYAVLASIVHNCKAYCVAKPFVRLISRANWNKKGQLFKSTLTLASLINSFIKLGYSKSTVSKLIDKIAKNLTLTTIGSKRDGIEVTSEHIKGIFREFFLTHPIYSIISIFLILFPNSFYRTAYWVYKRCKRS